MNPRDCWRTQRVSALCDACHQPAEPAHLPLKVRGIFCPRCCLVCNGTVTVDEPAERTTAKDPVGVGKSLKMLASRTAGAAVFKEITRGHNAN